MHANASTVTSKARTYSSPRTVASRSQTLGLPALPPATRKSPVASPFAAQTRTCLPRSSSATNSTSRPTFFSFGVILAEIAARRLADDTHFARSAPSFAIDAEEVRRLADTGCPPEFTQLAIECISAEPTKRPAIRVILDRLRAIESRSTGAPRGSKTRTTLAVSSL